MTHDPDKRKLRQLKRESRCAGSKHRRRDLKRQPAENPEEASHGEENFGRFSSEGLNHLDNDATRRKKTAEEEE